MIVRLARGLERRDIVTDPSAIPGPGRDVTGPVSVTEAMKVVAVFACIRAISHAMSCVPLVLYEDLGDSRQRATDHPSWTLLHDRPHPDLTPSELYGLTAGHIAGWGNAYWVKKRERGRVVSVFPAPPEWTRPYRNAQGQLVYKFHAPGGVAELAARDVVHIRGFGTDGYRGLSPIEVARDVLGAARAEDRYRRNVLANDARVGGYLSTDKELSPEAAKRLGKTWQANYGGPDNAGKVAVLEEGLEWKQLSMSAADLQFVEQRLQSVAEIARLFGVPPSKVNAPSPDSLTYSTKEGESVAFITDTLLFYARRIEQAVGHDEELVPLASRLVPEFLFDALLRADSKTRAEVYARGHNRWLTTNDIRRRENLPPVEGGDELDASQAAAIPAKVESASNGNGRTVPIPALS